MVARRALVLVSGGMAELPVADTLISTAYTLATKTASYTETATTGEVIALCTLTAGFTATLPTAVGNTAKLVFKKMLSAGQITIAAAGGQTVDGAASAVLNNQYESITLVSDGSNWAIV